MCTGERQRDKRDKRERERERGEIRYSKKPQGVQMGRAG
jgi:hypothetical protein